MYCFDSLMTMLGHHFAAILLAKMLIWVPFLQSRSTYLSILTSVHGKTPVVDLRNANLSLMEFQVRYMVLFLLFSVIDCFKWFWVGSLPKNIQLMLQFLKIQFLVLHFSYYTLMIFLTMLSVILLSMLMMLLSILSVIRHLICGNN